MKNLRYDGLNIKPEEKKIVDEYFREIDEIIEEENISSYKEVEGYSFGRIGNSNFEKNILISTYKMIFSKDLGVVEKGKIFEVFARSLFTSYKKMTDRDEGVFNFLAKFIEKFRLDTIKSLNANTMKALLKERNIKGMMDLRQAISCFMTTDIPKKEYVKEKYENLGDLIDSLYVGSDELSKSIAVFENFKKDLNDEAKKKIKIFGREIRDNKYNDNNWIFTLSTGLRPTILNKKSLGLNDVIKVYKNHSLGMSFLNFIPYEKDFVIDPKEWYKSNEEELLEELDKPLNQRKDPLQLKGYSLVNLGKNIKKMDFNDFFNRSGVDEFFRDLDMENFFKSLDELIEYLPDRDKEQFLSPVLRNYRLSTKFRYWNTKTKKADDEMNRDEYNKYREERVKSLPVSTYNIRYFMFSEFLNGRFNNMNFYTLMLFLKGNFHYLSFSSHEEEVESAGEFGCEQLVYKLYFLYEFASYFEKLLLYLRDLIYEDFHNIYFVDSILVFLRDSTSLSGRDEKGQYERLYNEIYNSLMVKFKELYDYVEMEIAKDLAWINEVIAIRVEGGEEDFEDGDKPIRMTGLIERNGITRRDLADRLGISRPILHKILTGKVDGMSFVDFLLLLKDYEATPYEILPPRVAHGKDKKMFY